MSVTQVFTFGALLRGHRRSAGLTQEELAERAGLSVRAVSDLERDVGHRPRKDTVQLLIDALQLGSDEQRGFRASARGAVTSQPPPNTTQPAGSFLGALPPDRLIGRRSELRRVVGTLDVVSSGNGRLVLLVGEPGIGKTRLAQEITLAARDRDFLVVTGRCYEPEQTVAFYPFLEALNAAYTAAPEALRSETLQRWSPLARLLPDQDLAPPPSGGGPEEQQRLFRSVTAFLQALAQISPVALLLDDLHWSDGASLKLLRHLARHTRGDRILLLGTYRDADVSPQHALDKTLIDLNRERLLERVVVRRLDHDGTMELISATIGKVEDADELAALLHQSTDGNPFFVQEVLRALQERGDIYLENGGWKRRDIQEIHVPETVQAAIAERLSRLRLDSQSVLLQASILGHTFTFDDLMSIDDQSEDALEESLQEAVGAGLLQSVGEDTYNFSHAITQQALYLEVPSRRRRRLHLAAGHALEQLPEQARSRRIPELAWHFLQGNDPQRALPYVMLAGDQAGRVFAYGEAERYYRTALELAPDLRDPSGDLGLLPMETEALAKLGRVLHITERYDEALEVLERVATEYHTHGNLDGEGPIVAEIGWIYYSLGRAEEGVTRIRPLIALLEQENDSPGRLLSLAALYTGLARLYFGLGRYHDELMVANQAATLARRLGDPLVLGSAEARRGVALMAVGNRNEACRVLKEAATLSEAAGNLGTESGAFDNLGQLYREEGRFLESRTCFERALELAEQTGVASRVAWVTVKLGRISLLLGNWKEARAYFERALGIARSADLSSPTTYFLLFIARVDLLEGTGEQAVEILDHAAIAAMARGDLWIARQAEWFLAEWHLQQGQPESVISRLQPLLDRPGLMEPQVTQVLPALAYAHLQLGNLTEAQEILERCEERLRSHDHRPASVEVLRAKGILWTQQKRWDDALHAFAEGVALAQAMPYPDAEARILYANASALAHRGETLQARELFQRALSIFHRLGARPYIDRTNQALRALDEPPISHPTA